MLPRNHADQSLIADSIFSDELFGRLPPSDLKPLTSIESRKSMLPGIMVFGPENPTHEIYVHRFGRAALFLDEHPLQTVYACPVEANRIYGIVEAVSGQPFDISM